MKRIQIKKLGIVTNQAELPEPEASAWLEQGQREHWFGKPARYESQQFLVSEERTEERELLDDEGNSFDPKQFETITIPAEYEWREVLIEPAEEYEVVVTDITAELEASALKAGKIAKGQAARQACQDVLDLISGFNLDRQLTIEQITQMQQTFAQAEAALRAGRPTFAKSFIAAIEVDGEIVTQEMKDMAIEHLGEW